jgi:hypothetical protein
MSEIGELPSAGAAIDERSGRRSQSADDPAERLNRPSKRSDTPR